MTYPTGSSPDRPLAPAPVRNGSTNEAAPGPQTMPYTCQTCSRRKVKCDKSVPVCSTCRKAKIDCRYQAPPPRRKKRKLGDDNSDETARVGQAPARHRKRKLGEDIRPETPHVGKLVSAGSGKTRYIDSNLWHAIDDDEAQLSEDDDDEAELNYIHDPLTGALAGHQRHLSDDHPHSELAKVLWSLYIDNVDPLCRVLHVPSMDAVIDQAARNPRNISKSIECLLFAIYHFAVVSMTKDECLSTMKETQSVVESRYRQATCQALVNAGFLKTSEMQVLQAYVLFLLAVRTHYDPHTFWILSGVAFRIGQRLGIHRDGEMLGLPPFEVQMRRRLFWQLLPLDNIASQIAGTGIAPVVDSWDTKQPLNLNEDQIWPGMTHQPDERVGATDMIFCIARTEVGRFHHRTKSVLHISDNSNATPQELARVEAEGLEQQIAEMEDLLERRIVPYCDVVDPLHFMTISICRGAMSVIRLRVKISLSKHQPISSENMREVYRLAMKVVDYGIAVHETPGLQRYMWHFRALFQHSSVACALTSLRNPVFLSPQEIRGAWEKIGKLYSHHPELTAPKGALQVAIGRLTLKSWDSSAYNAGIVTEPGFISTLRSVRHGDKPRQKHTRELPISIESGQSKYISPDITDVSTNLSLDDPGVNYDFSLDDMDWLYWDRMMEDYQASSVQPIDQLLPVS